MNNVIHKLEERLAPLTKRIETLEKHHSLKGVDAITWQSAEEDDIIRQLDALATLAMQAGSVFSRNVGKKLQCLATRMQFLPSVPRIEVVRFAQNILAQNPVMLVTDDAFHEKRQRPELTHIFLMKPAGTLCFDYQFPSFPDQIKGDLAPGEVVNVDEADPLSPSLEKAWTELQSAVHGRYVVAYELPFAQVQLAVTAQRYGLPVPMLVGHSLLDLLLKYARVKEPIGEELDEHAPPFSDAQLSRVLAEEDVASFVDSLRVPADQRALYMLQALQAIANGTFTLQEPLPVSSLMQFAPRSKRKDLH
jgi:hypothetical protein